MIKVLLSLAQKGWRISILIKDASLSPIMTFIDSFLQRCFNLIEMNPPVSISLGDS
jgi:hypothetical protein